MFLLAFTFVGCNQEPPLTPTDEVEVNVYFYHPDGNEEFLGRTTGTSSCYEIVSEFAASQGYESIDSWAESCCTIENGSDCYRKFMRARLVE
jgi:hypothetical protein